MLPRVDLLLFVDDEDGMCYDVMRRSGNYCSHKKKLVKAEEWVLMKSLSYRYGRDVEIYFAAVTTIDDLEGSFLNGTTMR